MELIPFLVLAVFLSIVIGSSAAEGFNEFEKREAQKQKDQARRWRLQMDQKSERKPKGRVHESPPKADAEAGKGQEEKG